MPLLPTNAETLLTGLSDFWQRFFADKDQLNVLYAATEELLGQAYLDIVTQVLNANLANVPLFNREYWHLLTIREDALFYVPGAAWPYRFELADNLREFVFLLNRIYDPTASFELDIDFLLVDGVMQWKADPFTQTDGIPIRQLDITPTVYRAGTDGMWDDGVWPASPPAVPPPPPATTDTFTILGNVQEGGDGVVDVVDRFSSAGAVFTPADIGRKIYHTNTSDHTLAQEERTITGVLNDTTVFCTPDALVALPGAPVLQWAMRDEGYFNEFDVGRVIELTNPANARDTYEYTIAEVIDVPATLTSGLSVRFTEEIDTLFFLQRRIPWRHQSQARVQQAAYWVPDAFFDRENLYLSFGYLINRYEPSTESYRALIDGIFRYFMLGPTLSRVESALNVMVGVPVVREDGEVYQSLDIAPSGLHRVTTDRNSYEIPLGSLHPDIQVGDTLTAFQALTAIFSATDYVDNATWYHGSTVPPQLLPGPDTPRRDADPSLYPLVAGSDRWLVGDPFLYAGAGSSGIVPPRQDGDDVYHTGDTTRLRFAETVFTPEDVGKKLELEGIEYTIAAVLTDPDPYVTVTGAPALSTLYTANTYAGSSAGVGNVWDFPTAIFTANDIGRLLEVTISTTILVGKYRITDIVSPTSVRVEEYDTGASVVAPIDPAFTMRLGLKWDLETRPILRHSTGYLMMKNYLKTHIFQVTYDYTSYPDLSFPRPEDDIRDVLDAGKSSYTYMLVVPRSQFTDVVAVEDTLAFLGIAAFPASAPGGDLMKEEDYVITAGGGSVVGEYYAYSRPGVAWMDVVRSDEFASITELPGAELTEQVSVSAVLTGGTSPTLTVTWWAWTGASWVLTGDVSVLNPAVSNTDVVDTNGMRMAVAVVAAGGPSTAGVAFGFITNEPRTMIYTLPTVTSITGVTTVATNTFSDANVFFNDADILREILVTIGLVTYRYRIATVTDEHTVTVLDSIAGTTPVFAAHTDLEWHLGRPLRTTTPIVVGGVPADVTKAVAGNYIVPWPLQMTVQD